MEDLERYIKGKKITVMGLGLLGRGLGDARFLADAEADLIVTDLKSAKELEDSAVHLRPYPNVKLVLGEHRKEDFVDRDFILVAAGVPKQSEYLEYARANNVPLKMSAALLAEYTTVPVIGVTGTRGKSTVANLIHHTLVKAGRKSVLGGNIRGVSNLQLVNEIEGADVIVMELDSWQLQGFGWDGLSPQIAVFTNFMEDHQTYYQNMEEYFADKAQIYLHQKPGDILIAGEQVAKDWISRYPAPASFKVAVDLPADYELLIPGEHNRANAALAAEALREFGLKEPQIQAGFKSFAGVEGRLQYLKTVNGIEIYNDNNSTTPTATIAALKALGKDKNVVLICGGTDKGIDLSDLVPVVKKYVKHLVLYSGSGTEKLKESVSEEVSQEEHDTLEVCVAAAADVAEAGDIVLFSPGFSSFGHEYKNEYDRNDKFVAAVAKIFR